MSGRGQGRLLLLEGEILVEVVVKLDIVEFLGVVGIFFLFLHLLRSGLGLDF